MLFLYSHTTSLLIVDLFPGSGVLEVALNPASQTETLHFHPYLVICVQHESYRWHLFWRCSTLKREVSSPQWPFFRSVRTKERQTETERCGSLVSSLFCVLCLDANAVWEDSCPSVCCAHARIFSSLLPPFFLFFLSFSFYFKCVLAACFLIVSQVFIVLVCAAQLKKKLDTRNVLQQAASLDDKNGKQREMDLLCDTISPVLASPTRL